MEKAHEQENKSFMQILLLRLGLSLHLNAQCPPISPSHPFRHSNTAFHFKSDNKEHKSWQSGIMHSTCIPKEIWESAPDLLA